MPARGRELQRSSRALLTPDIREIGARWIRIAAVQRQCLDRRRNPVATQVADNLGQVANRDGLDAGERRLGRACRRAKKLRQAGLSRAFCRGQDAADPTQTAVQSELANGCVPLERLCRNLPGGGQHGQRDRKVEARSLLAKLCRSEIDRDPPQRPLQLGGRDSTANALLRFLARTVGESDDRKRGQASLKVSLHLDPSRVEADKGMGDGPCEHVVTVDNRPSHM